MTDSEVLWRDEDLGRIISRTSEPTEQTLSILDATVWGSRDTRYRVLGIGEKLARMRYPSFFVLAENGIEQCVFVLDHCIKHIGGQPCGAYHFVMAATLPDRRDQGFATRMIDVIRPYAEKTVGRPGFGFAYVEATTEISLKLSEHTGHAVEADVPLQLFSRLKPRLSSSVGTIREDEHQGILLGLKQLYADHELADFDLSFFPGETRVFRRNKEITASAQAEILNWQIVSMPGLSGRLLLDAMPSIPGWKRILDLQDLKVVRFGNIYFQEGRAADFFSLAETCLAENNTRVGLVMLDKKSPVLRALKQAGGFGLLSRAMAGSAKLRIDTVFMDDDLLTTLRTKPLLISPADVF